MTSLSRQIAGACLLSSTVFGGTAFAAPISVTLTEVDTFAPTLTPGATYGGTIDVLGYDGSAAGLFEVTAASFTVAVADGSLQTFDSSDSGILFDVDGTLFAEFDASGQLVDFVDDGDDGSPSTSFGWGLRSVFFSSEAAGTTKYDLYFDNSPSLSLWSMADVVKTEPAGGFGLQFGSLFRLGTYASAPSGAVPGPASLGLLLLGAFGLLRRRAR